MATGFYPRALVKNIPPGVNDPPIVPRIAVLHVAVSKADSLFDFFATKSGGIESHFYVRFDGTVEQYRSIYWQADAQLDANNWCVSIETAGMGDGEWTPEQLASIKTLLMWLHVEAGIKLERCTAWDGEGVGYHVMWGAPSHWTPSVKTCPGPQRIVQYEDIIVPWMAEASKPRTHLRFTSANLDFVRGHDAAYLAHLCESADVLLVQEAKDVRLADVLPVGWTALQDTTSEATMGSAIAYRNETVRGPVVPTLHEGARPFWRSMRVQMLTRYIATAQLRDRATDGWFYAVAAHLPPKRFRFLQPGMVRNLRKVIKGHPHVVIGLDANQPLARLADILSRKSFGEGIVGLIIGPGLRITKGEVDNWGIDNKVTDHPAVTVRVRHI